MKLKKKKIISHFIRRVHFHILIQSRIIICFQNSQRLKGLVTRQVELFIYLLLRGGALFQYLFWNWVIILHWIRIGMWIFMWKWTHIKQSDGGNAEYPFIATAPRSTLAWSGSTR